MRPYQAPAIAIVPYDAERMFRRELFADLTGQDRAVDRRHDGTMKVDQHGLRRELSHELVFIPEDSSPFLLQFVLFEAIPQMIIKWIGGDGRIDFPAGGEGPCPEVFVLNILEKPRRRLIVRPFPCQDRARLFHVEIGIGKAGKGLLCGDVMIEHEECLILSGEDFQRFAGIAEIHDDDSLAFQPCGRWIAVFDRNKAGRGEPTP